MPAKRHVLLVEDSASDAALIKAHLRSDGRFDVVHVETLTDTRDVLRNGNQTDAVILDLNLPDSTGLETFTKIHEQFPEVPVVILSGFENEELAVAAVAQGAQDYVPKNMADVDILVRSLLYAIERNKLQVVERKQRLIEIDMDIARQVQQHLLPSKPPSIDGFDIAAVCQPAEACGGDFFDFIPIPRRDIEPTFSETDGRDANLWDLLIADVSSHGFGPALIMVGARRVLRTCAPMHNDIGEIVTVANRAVTEDTLAEQFVTLFYARLDPQQRTLAYAAAGHESWVLDVNGEIAILESADLPLGLVSDATYPTAGSVTLQPGEIVLLMTDGVFEAAASDGEMFGQQRTFDFIHQHRDRPATEILERLLAEVSSFCRPAKPNDDVTVVLVKAID